MADDEVQVTVARVGGQLRCSKCGKACPGDDQRTRRWYHLDTCQLKTVLRAEVPRAECDEHGMVTVNVPWAEPGSGITARFEALVINWLKQASTSAVADQLRLSWNAVDGVMQRAVKRSLSRRGELSPRRLSVDETTYRKDHDYVTLVTDQEQAVVVHVTDERDTDSLAGFYSMLSEQQKDGFESVCMDMWPAYIKPTRDALADADDKIAFDHFHVAHYLGKAVDQVRRHEHRQLMRQGDERMKGSKYQGLRNRGNMSWHQQRDFSSLRQSSLKTARAWAIKEMATHLWDYRSYGWAEEGWKRLISCMARRRLKPMQVTAKTLRRHLPGILNVVILGVNNSHTESMNSRIKTVKSRARGFRNKQRFHNAIYFHLGGLQLYPAGIKL